MRRRGRQAACIGLAAMALCEARLRLAMIRNEKLSAWLAAGGTQRVGDMPDRAWLHDFAWALQGVARRAPFRADCLVRTLAADRVLSILGWPCEIHLQAGTGASGFAAHASLACAGVEVTGGPNAGLVTLLRSERLPQDDTRRT